MRGRAVPAAAVVCATLLAASGGVVAAAATTVGRARGAGAAAAPRAAQGKGAATAAGPLAYPPVIAQALSALRAEVGASVPLGAPTRLPTEPPSHTFLTARTRATGRGWSVEVLKADQAYAVNNPAIVSAVAHAVPVVRFGAAFLPGVQPASTSAAMPAFLWRAGLRARGLVPQNQDVPVPAGRPVAMVALGAGIAGALFATGPDTDTLVWHEGDWTLSVMDTTRATALALGRVVVAYLHHAFMPPYPGLVAVAIGVNGVYTRIDWRVGSTLYYVDNDLRAGDNPVDACAMAVSWRDA